MRLLKKNAFYYILDLYNTLKFLDMHKNVTFLELSVAYYYLLVLISKEMLRAPAGIRV